MHQMDGVFDTVHVRQGVKFIEVFSEIFSHFISWGPSPVYNWSDGGVFFMDFDEASDSRWRWVKVDYLSFFVFLD